MLQGTALPSLVIAGLKLARRIALAAASSKPWPPRSITLTWTTLPFSSMPSFNSTTPSIPRRFASGG